MRQIEKQQTAFQVLDKENVTLNATWTVFCSVFSSFPAFFPALFHCGP